MANRVRRKAPSSVKVAVLRMKRKNATAAREAGELRHYRDRHPVLVRRNSEQADQVDSLRKVTESKLFAVVAENMRDAILARLPVEWADSLRNVVATAAFQTTARLDARGDRGGVVAAVELTVPQQRVGMCRLFSPRELKS